MKPPKYNHYRMMAACAVSVFALLQASPAMAGDEDMSPNAYHVFDPETGYMTTVDPMTEAELAKAKADGQYDVSAVTSSDNTPQSSGQGTRGLWFILIAAILMGFAYLGWRRFVRRRPTQSEATN